jgi:acetyltransferase-like isoleucine patch superfamily enzyme
MKGAVKILLRDTITPILRVLNPAFENLRRIHAYLVLSSHINSPVDASVVVMGTPEVRGTGAIRLGKGLLLYPAAYLETCGSGSIVIGDNVVLSRGVHIVSHASVTIGAGSMIGEYTSIRDANHLRDDHGAMRDGAHFAAPISIGSQVWIGRGVTVLAGVSIGDNATVGANAVVTRSVPSGVTVVGVPAAPITSAKGRGLREEALRRA